MEKERERKGESFGDKTSAENHRMRGAQDIEVVDLISQAKLLIASSSLAVVAAYSEWGEVL